MAESNLTLERLREALTYDPTTGEFRWLKKTAQRVQVGEPAGGTGHPSGYCHIRLDGRRYPAHRLAWFHVYGTWPKVLIDHINGVRDDNRIANLREADRSINAQNEHGLRANNTSGYPGVTSHWGGWRARINLSGKRTHIGTYLTKEEAHRAYLDAKRRLHPGCTI